MVDLTNNLLRTICENLSQGDVANFVADVKVYQSEITNGMSEVELIEKTFGSMAKVGGIVKSDLTEMISTVKECFEYLGDDGSHPNKNYLSSEQMKTEVAEVLENLQNLFSKNTEIYTFWLSCGHPFYPVFWDYAFFAKNNKECFILIGSSSD